MTDYKALYTRLFNRMTDAIENLQSIQTELEEAYLVQEAEGEFGEKSGFFEQTC